MSIQYNVMLGHLRSASRDLGNFAGLGDEAKLRRVRQYGLLQRDMDTQRSLVMEIYGGLLQMSCAPFDKEGYARTFSEFQRVSREEREVLADAKRRSDNGLVRVK